jgi:hypothetical protein
MMQYVFVISGNQIKYQVQYWGPVPPSGNFAPLYTIPPNEGEQLILSLPSNTVPARYLFEIDLNNNDMANPDNVTDGTFSVTDNNGNTTSLPFQVAANYQFPIYAFQVNIGGPDNCSCSEFSSGGGTITYSSAAPIGQLCVKAGSPGGVCGTPGAITCETSNATYGPIGPACCSGELSQSVGFDTTKTCPYPFQVCGAPSKTGCH